MPLVVLDRTVHLPNVDLVSVTNAEGSAQAVAHLVELGHRRIAMIAGLEAHNVGAERRRGFIAGLGRRGPPVDPALIRDGGFEREAARRATHELLGLPDPPTAIFSANNTMSLGVLQALHERGHRCPDDVSLVGFDDMPWQVATQPPLTCIAQPTYDIGATAARLLIRAHRRPDAAGASRRPRNLAHRPRLVGTTESAVESSTPAIAHARAAALLHRRRLAGLRRHRFSRAAAALQRRLRRRGRSSRWS